MAMRSSYLALKADTVTVTKLLLFTGNIPRGVFLSEGHRKPETCRANLCD